VSPSTALVIGASSPVGGFLAEQLARRGVAVTRHGHRHAGAGEGWLRIDLSEEDGVRALEAWVSRRAPELLVWAAGTLPAPGAARFQDSVTGYVLHAHAPLQVGLAHLDVASRPLQIHLSDTAADDPFLKRPAHSAGRAAQRSVIRHLQAVAPADAVVVELSLGIVSIAGRERADEARVVARDVPAARPAHLDEIARALDAVLARPTAFRGATLRLDGGLALRGR
jgi:NAD(P)-dependent dehydrogenase (short-subunit alcohol dehydrogenase family)